MLERVLLGVSGSVSAYKAPWIVRELQRRGAEVRVVMTPSAARFVAPLALQTVSRHPVVVDPFADDAQQDGSWHVHLARWCTLALVAPCSATTLARLAHGLADNALGLALLSLPRGTPLLLCPAMDPDMWLHAATARNLAQLAADGARILPPEEGELASGLVGPGRLPEPRQVAEWALGRPSLERRGVLITAGPTREPVDQVRFLSNHSSGKMGYALAAEAARRGARVTLISGPVCLPSPPGVTRIEVETAADMLAACQTHYAQADIVIKAAAVADFTLSRPAAGKLKKEALGKNPSLELTRTVDILAWMGQHKSPRQVLVGFALEMADPEENARRKLRNKGCDLVVLNRGGEPESGFGGDNNTITLVDASGLRPLPAASKAQCAAWILDDVERRVDA